MPRTLLDPALLDRLRVLELRVRRPVAGALPGRHRSPSRGAGVEFTGHEEYSPGADLRRVDFRVLGRLDRIYLKRFEERTELPAVIVVDASASMGYRGPRARGSKLDVAASIAAALAHVLAEQGDPVGLLVFGPAEELLPPSTRPTHLREFLDRLGRAEADGGRTHLEAAAQRAARAVRRRGLVVIISDLYDFAADPRRLLAWLRRRHEVVVVGIADPDEEDLPWDGPTVLEALEGAGRVWTDPPALRDAYRGELARFRGAWTDAAGECGADLRFVRTDVALEDALATLLVPRAGRRNVA